MINLIVLVGRLGKAPEMAYSANGTAVTKFSIATDDGWGESRTATWHNIVTFKKSAEACAQYLDKGSLVAVVGRQTHRKYEDKGGQTRYFAEVVADRVQFLESRDGAQANESEDEDSLPF